MGRVRACEPECVHQFISGRENVKDRGRHELVTHHKDLRTHIFAYLLEVVLLNESRASQSKRQLGGSGMDPHLGVLVYLRDQLAYGLNNQNASW